MPAAAVAPALLPGPTPLAGCTWSRSSGTMYEMVRSSQSRPPAARRALKSSSGRAPAHSSKPRRATGKRVQDPEGTKRDILEIALEEFALNGLAGARVDVIAARTRSSKRMIYYYFGDKEGLYLSALENAYRVVREGEARLDIAGLAPAE